MNRYNCTSSDKRGAFGLCMEEHKEGMFVPFSEVDPLNNRISQLIDDRSMAGVAISNAILSGVVPDKHPLRSRLELLANHRKLLIDKSELCDDLLDLVERMVSYLGLAGDEPEKDSYNPMKAWMYDAITTMAGQRQKIPVTVTETIRTAPERIWLQVGDSQGDSDYPFPEHHDEVTWCSDSVIACEVPYVRADLAGKQPDAWLPIETAPRDGRKALVYRPLAENSGDERIAVKRLTGGQSNNCWDKTVPPGATPCNPTDGACHVTHWMPLPDDPVQQGGEPCATEPPSSSPA
ncbi:hypothetical protein [Aeromonas jandaei]|uniref:hypothetical protein n=1 Tax=Aeromonas jandaei TaxID=650 RepID=UPI00059D8A15|nr:hypothetical protein [Aeromonas jandaei]